MPTRRALLSLSDKTGLATFASDLVRLGFEILSTGGTKDALQKETIPVTSVEAFTESPEVMGGRVKTLHPRVHGGILQRGIVDEADLARIGGAPIELVAVTLYPFEKVLEDREAKLADLIENIDIGGPAMLRSAAKNHERVTVVCDPADYSLVVAELERAGGTSLATRRSLAAKAYARTAAYDGLIAGYLSSIAPDAATSSTPARAAYPAHLVLSFEKVYGLRYGENPHQSGALYRDRTAEKGSLVTATSLGAGGKELSFNNLVDADAAWEAAREHERPAAVVVKHTNPCGVALGASIEDAYRAARAADETSAFGGIVALNRPVDRGAAGALAETFLECIVAPSFTDEALAVLREKKNLRLLATSAWLASNAHALSFKRVGGGLVAQDRDATGAAEVASAKVASKRAPTKDELSALDFAWRVVKHVKSNAIVIGANDRTLGVGAGQMSRVESVRLACAKAGERAVGAALASDAFFPFPDGVEVALAHGVTAFVQPGGSVKDPAVIETIDRAGATMVFTGARHFRH